MIEFPWDFTIIPSYFPLFVPAALITLQITTMGILLGLVLGLIFSLMRLSPLQVLNGPARLYIWAIRGTPLLLQLFIIYFGFATIFTLPRFLAAILALGIHNGAYIAEILRGAIQSIDRGQSEAAFSLGMTRWQAMKRIILPQAFKRAVPPLGNQFIIALKDSSLASTVGVHELLYNARVLGAYHFTMMEMLVIAAIFYLFMTSIFTLVLGRVEHRLRASDYRG